MASKAELAARWERKKARDAVASERSFHERLAALKSRYENATHPNDRVDAGLGILRMEGTVSEHDIADSDPSIRMMMPDGSLVPYHRLRRNIGTEWLAGFRALAS